MAVDELHHLLLYEYVPDMAQRRGPHRDAHLQCIAAERRDGHIGQAGAFDPPAGAAIVFTGVDREHVERFVSDDPYNRAGLIAGWRIERWKLV